MSTTPTEILETAAAVLETTAATEAPLDIASIKGMMDAFDPASLLPEMSEVFGSLATVCRIAVMIGPIVMLIMGLAYLFLSPKEANWVFGYRCYFGMGSVYAWRTTQRLAGVVWSALGIVLTVIMAIISTGFDGKDTAQVIGTAMSCILWEAVLAAVSAVAINTIVALNFDADGELRKKEPAASK